MAAYGWEWPLEDEVQDEVKDEAVLERLLALNLARAQGSESVLEAAET